MYKTGFGSVFKYGENQFHKPKILFMTSLTSKC